MKNFWSLIVLTVLTASCTRVDQSTDDVLLPRLPPVLAGTGDARLQALLVGHLVIDQGCIKVENSGMVTVLWYREVQLAQKSPPMLRDTSTGRTYRIGDQVNVGGGSYNPAAVNRELNEVATRCGPPYFIGYFSK
jgi:hypothetical protein